MRQPRLRCPARHCGYIGQAMSAGFGPPRTLPAISRPYRPFQKARLAGPEKAESCRHSYRTLPRIPPRGDKKRGIPRKYWPWKPRREKPFGSRYSPENISTKAARYWLARGRYQWRNRCRSADWDGRRNGPTCPIPPLSSFANKSSS